MAKGIHVATWDPHIEFDNPPKDVEIIRDITQAKGFDAAILVTAHEACLSLDWSSLFNSMRTPIIYDGRRVLDLEMLGAIGWQVHAVGRPA